MKCLSCGADLITGTQACPRCGLQVATRGSESRPSLFAPVLIVIACVMLFGFAFIGGAFLILRSQLTTNAFYQETLGIARNSPMLQGLIGQPMQDGWMAMGEVRRVHGSDFAEWTVPLKGPKGRGRLEGVANRIGASWHYSRLLFRREGSDADVDITPLPARDKLLAGESSKTVYLVPIGAVREEYLSWAPAYYQAKFGLKVEILSAIPLSASLWNPGRHQLIAESIIAKMKETLAEKAKDLQAILVGVTAEDMYIRSYDWNYAINYREDARYGVVSTARLLPTLFFQKWNYALAISRLQKMLTKNVYLLCFNVPLSSDDTSAVSGGVMSPGEADYMSDEIIGAENRWHSLLTGTVPTISMITTPGQPAAWNMEWSAKPPADVSSEYFAADLWAGLLLQRRTDVYLDGDFALQFVRVYATQDPQSREFGVGTNDSLDISIGGEPGKYMALTLENGVRTYFDRDAARDSGGRQAYRGRADYFSPFSQGTIMMRGYDIEIEGTDGWHYFFPYRPGAKSEEKYSVLTGYSDPQGKRFEMQRNDAGDLLRVTTPAGQWLKFERDEGNRVRRIEDSKGRVVNYEYDSGGRLVRVFDSEGNSEAYRYGEKNEMVAVLDGQGRVQMSMSYFADGWISGQTLADGRSFQYEYRRDRSRNLAEIRFTDPRGYVTLFDYVGKQYLQSLPSQSANPQQTDAQPFLE
jgi:YD repeat-containing protein